jgi:hypothetical protein
LKNENQSPIDPDQVFDRDPDPAQIFSIAIRPKNPDTGVKRSHQVPSCHGNPLMAAAIMRGCFDCEYLIP